MRKGALNHLVGAMISYIGCLNGQPVPISDDEWNKEESQVRPAIMYILNSTRCAYSDEELIEKISQPDVDLSDEFKEDLKVGNSGTEVSHARQVVRSILQQMADDGEIQFQYHKDDEDISRPHYKANQSGRSTT